MKFTRFGLALVMLAVFASLAFAQAPPAGDAAKATATPAATKSATTTTKPAAAPMKSPEEMAKASLAKWKDTLKITDEQAPKFEAVMTDSYKKMADAHAAANGDKTKMKTSMTSIMKDRNEDLAKVLTPDQMKIYNEKMAAMQNKAKEHMAKAATEGTAK